MAATLWKDLSIAGRVARKAGPPVSLIFFVTSRCNLLCKHCFYWEELNKRKNELTLDEIRKVARSLPNLLNLSLTGGEPYLRRDLPEIAEAFERHSGVRNIQIPSNGHLVERTVRSVEEMLSRVRRARVATGVSLDGPEEVHNRIRQNDASFQRAVETLAKLKELKPRFPNLSVGVALTVTSANQDRLDEFFEYVTGELQPDAVTVTLARGNPIDEDLKKVDSEKYFRFTRKVIDYRRRNGHSASWRDRLVIAKEEETYRLVRDASLARKRISPCYGGELIGVLSETGEVYLCETLDRSMGNIREFDGDLGRLWKATAAAEARQYQKDLGCQCTYECAMSVNTLFQPRRTLRILKNSLGNRPGGGI